MASERDLRRQAARARKAAAHPTEGGDVTDKMLLQLADELDRKADEIKARRRRSKALAG